ncbi:hypothetical protein SAMN05421768_1121, partial [Chryseobacterium joostei]
GEGLGFVLMDSGRSFPWGLSQGKAKGNFLPDG